MPPELVVAHGLSRRFGTLEAVRDVSLTLSAGETLGLLGPNGAGKTTTLRMLAGVLSPDAGSVTIAGIDAAARPEDARRHIGYLPEHPPLHDHATVDEFLSFAARLHGIAPGAVPDAVAVAMSACALTEVGPRLIRNLSKGYQQRVGIAHAIVHDPNIIILDEPTVGLDPNQIRDVRALIATLASDRAVILSTHILPEIAAVCSRVAIMHRGRIVHDGPVAATAGAPARYRVRLATPPESSVLEQSDGIDAVETLDEHSFVITAADPVAISTAAAAGGWGLTELRRSDDLDAMFVTLTTGDPA
ncbi:MAG: ABC transporter ATP-binding protein [Gammaproteobacteria bacterium]|nr:ABC transporter ATP-binding protein [Gammaproteobacteria bacterium]NNL99889.1 ABC transporter ATP-binding protein [Gammaproteobacteria bacterium]